MIITNFPQSKILLDMLGDLTEIITNNQSLTQELSELYPIIAQLSDIQLEMNQLELIGTQMDGESEILRQKINEIIQIWKSN